MTYQKKLLFFFIFITIFVSAGFFGTGIYYGHDANFHLIRIESVARSIEAGDFFAPIHYFYMDGYGYGTGLFYSNMFVYFPALLRVIGLGLVDAFRVTMIVATFLTLYTMYYFVKTLTRSRPAALIAAVLYALSSYRLTDLYIRAAYGELFAFIFLPLVFAGAYLIISGESKKWQVLAIGMLGILFSHILTFAVCVCMLILLFAVNFKKVFPDKERRKSLLLATLCTAALSAGFVLPMLEQFHSERFVVNVSASATSEFSIDQHALYPIQLFFINMTYGTSNPLSDGIKGEMTLSLGFLPASVPLLLLFINNKGGDMKQAVFIGRISLVLGWAFALATTVLFPWEYFKNILAAFQFPWRLLLFATFFLSLSGGIAVPGILKEKKERIFALGIITTLALIFTIQPIVTYTRFEYPITSKNELYIFHLGGNEYLPEGTRHREYEHRGNIITTPGSGVAGYTGERKGRYYRFTPDSLSKPDYVELPLLYYLGYKAYTDDEHGRRISLPVSKGTNSVVRVGFENYSSGEIRVIYEGTLIFRLSKAFSILAFVYVLWLWIKQFTTYWRQTIA